ncbi:hypothetical protein [Novosphingobium sp. P6W]|uniref:hypothetical protein n=1 Tax=Novosphingobium sp. P6W TaxID=1609758 RepID=UPI0005C30CEB|nr:hypothetical protein [Novosphingobium sp. P6W]AXB75823.1 hypothetical protein TQ38_004245 [Novosphingobium sp. P6W]KIS32968.1 hypothetical protein TQ38_05640 [Novosphingobium sp. P6W]
MRKFTKLVAPALVAVLGLSAIAPTIAEAAPRHEAARYTPNRNANIRADISGLRAQIDRAAARRTISQREATGLRRDAADVQRLYSSYARGGLSAQETRTLQNRVNKVYTALHMERRDYDGRRG